MVSFRYIYLQNGSSSHNKLFFIFKIYQVYIKSNFTRPFLSFRTLLQKLFINLVYLAKDLKIYEAKDLKIYEAKDLNIYEVNLNLLFFQ